MDTTELRVDAIKRNLGIGYVMKKSVEKELKNGELSELDLPIELPVVDINLLYRTTALLPRIYDFFRSLYLAGIEKDLLEISAFSKSIDGTLPKDYWGRRFYFYKGTPFRNIFDSILRTYTSSCASGNIYPILTAFIEKPSGFFSAEVKEYLEI